MARKRRTSTQHTGVKIIQRTVASGKKVWVARWTDPFTGKSQQRTFASLGVTNKEGRDDWAKMKAGQLQKERQGAAVHGSVNRPGPTAPAKRVSDYLAEKKQEGRRQPTIDTYRQALDRFVEWCQQARIQTLHNLEATGLHALKGWLRRYKKRVSVAGKREKATNGATRSRITINKDLEKVRVFLNDARKGGFTPRLSRDDILDNLDADQAEKDVPDFLSPAEVRKLLEACLRHDAVTFKLTREENAGKGEPGTTPRFPPIAHFVLFVLLSGCRLREALELNESALLLEGSRPAIRLRSAAVKTKHWRTIDLAVSPSLVALLGALRMRPGEYVFGGSGPLSREFVQSARKRLSRDFGAGGFTWQGLRRTCATVLVNAPGVYGGAAFFHESKRLGHSVTVAEKHYAGLLHDLPKDATTIEAALEIEKQAAAIVERAAGVERREEARA